jgi:DNA-binding NarL/FixJ family response regulator
MKVSKTALIVEDNLVLSLLYENYMKQSVFKTVGEIKSGTIAIQLVKKYKPEVVIMDIKLQGDIDGITASEEIRKFSEVPIIFVTGNSDIESISRAKAVKNSIFLSKPISEEILKNAVDEILAKA